jgi:hypothetical protein
LWVTPLSIEPPGWCPVLRTSAGRGVKWNEQGQQSKARKEKLQKFSGSKLPYPKQKIAKLTT